MKHREFEFFETDAGRCEVADFIEAVGEAASVAAAEVQHDADHQAEERAD